MAKTKQSRQERAVKVGERLRAKYPQPRTALNWSSPLELLVATMLSAQTTDAGVNRVTERLFQKYRSAADYADASPVEMEQDLHATGFYRQKARNVISTGQILVERFGGQVPDDMDRLQELPGVARKTANVVLGNAFGRAAGIAVDRHVARVAVRLGLTDHTIPSDIERDLMRIIPQADWTDFSHRVIFHGREVCTARNPRCRECQLNDICPSAFAM